MQSNIEAMARAIAEKICRRQGMPEDRIAAWIDSHWEVAAAMLEAGSMDENGAWLPDGDVRNGLKAYRERSFGRDRSRA